MSFTSVSLNMNGYNGFTFSPPKTPRNQEQESLYQNMKNDLSANANEFCLKFRDYFELIQETMDVVKIGQEIASFCHEHDPLDEGPYLNGYRMIVRRFLKFLRHVNKISVVDDKLVTKLKLIMAQLKKNVHIVDGIREAEKKYGYSFHEDKVDITVESFKSFIMEGDKLHDLMLDPLVHEFGFGYFGKVLYFYAYFFIGFSYTTSWFLAILSYFHKKTRYSTLKDFYLMKNLKGLLCCISYAAGFLSTKLVVFFYYGSWFTPWNPYPFLYKRIDVSPQHEWSLNVDVIKKDINLVKEGDSENSPITNATNQSNSKPISCLVVRKDFEEDKNNKKSNPFKNKVFVYCHGGGYIACSAATSMHFLGSFAKKMPGLTIISIDCSVAPYVKFPVPVQECLDVLLWLQSGDTSVKHLLGITPESFVYSGDSGGAHMLMTATMVMNDINRRNKAEGNNAKKLLLPERFVGFFPVFVGNPITRASILTSLLDISLLPTALLAMVSCYLPELPERKDKLHPEYKCEHEWHLMTKADMKQSYLDFTFIFDHPYFNNSKYQHFEDLSSIELNVFCGDEDPIFDLATVLFSSWKGKVSMEIGNGLRHAFIYLMIVSRILLRGRVQKEITRIEDAFVAKMYGQGKECQLRDRNQNLEAVIAV